MSHRKAYLLFWNTPVHTCVCDLYICDYGTHLYMPVSETTVHTCICSTMGCSNTFASFCRMMYLLSANDVNSTFRSFWEGSNKGKDNLNLFLNEICLNWKKESIRGWRDVSEVKSTCCSCRGPSLSPCSHMASYKCLYIQFQGFQCPLLVFSGTRHPGLYVYTYTWAKHSYR